MNQACDGWVDCLCLVKFDIDEGQMIEWRRPENFLGADQEKQVSMLSFPDSNSFISSEGQLKYVFRVKKKQPYYGFTLFMQRKDEDNPRGYSQKSIVILTTLPLFGFYYSLLDTIARNISNDLDLKAQLNVNLFLILNWFQNIFNQIQTWAKPIKNTPLQLMLHEKSHYIEIPSYYDITSPLFENNEQQVKHQQHFQLVQLNGDLTIDTLISINDLREKGMFQETNLFNNLENDKLNLLTKLWELTITNQSFMIITDSPNQCSELVLGCVSLISPLTYTGDFRPYFTIYDTEFSQIQQELDQSIVRSIIIGVTNPFFLKSFKKFPFIIRLDKQYEKEQDKGFSQYVQSDKQIQIGEDKQLFKTLLPVKNEEIKIINNSVIKKTFRNLTLEFIGMLEMYFQTQTNVISIQTLQCLLQSIKRFEEKEFVEFIKGQKVSFQELFENKQKIVKLYQAFIRSANYLTYIQERGNVYFSKGNILN